MPGNVEKVLHNHIPGPIEAGMLGEVTDVGMRMKLGINETGKAIAQYEGDRVIYNILSKKLGLTREIPQGEFDTVLKLDSLNTSKIYTNKHVAETLKLIKASGEVDEMNDGFLKGMNSTFNFLVTAAKASKVIFNPPSYAVNFFSGQVSMLGLGLKNPFKGGQFAENYRKGSKLALKESALITKAVDRARKNTPENQKAYLDLWEEYERNGILNGNISADDLIENLRKIDASGGKMESIVDTGKGFFEFFGKAYSVTDIAARATVYESNKRTLQMMFPRLAGSVNRKELEDVAAAITNDTYQNYDYVGRIVRKLSRIGVMPQFVTFTAEFSRNMFHQARIARAMAMGDVNYIARKYGLSKNTLKDINLEEFKKEGRRRVGGLLTVTGLAAAGPTAWNSSQGIDQETDNDLRKTLPSWQKNKALLFFKTKKEGEINVANASYIVPHAILTQAISVGLDGKDQTNLMNFLVEEFVGEGTFVNQEMMRALDNRTPRGKEITLAPTEEERALDLIKYFVSATFEPGVFREFDKFMDSINDNENSRYTTQEVLGRQLGLRFQNYNIEEMVHYKLQDLMNSESDLKASYNTAYRKHTGEYTGDPVSAEELQETYERANEGSKYLYDQMQDLYQAMTRSFEFTQDKAVEVLTSPRSNISTRNAFRIIKGLPHQDIPVVPPTSIADRYDKMFGDETEISQFTDRQIMRKINSLRRDNPIDYKAFLNRYRSLKRDERSKLSTDYKLLKKMSVKDRAEAILELGYDKNRQEMIQLKRKGIWTKDVDMALRSMQ